MHASDVSRGRLILSRFLAIAEERLAHLIELYESGRWERYFTQAELLDNVRDAKKAVAAWTLLVSTEALPNNRPVDLSWLDSPRPLPQRKPLTQEVEMPRLSLRFIDQSIVPEAVVSGLLPPTMRESILIDLSLASLSPKDPVAEPESLPPWQNALDYALMEQRYPMLRKPA